MSMQRHRLTADAVLYTLVAQTAEGDERNVLPSTITRTLKWAPAGLEEWEVIRALNELRDMKCVDIEDPYSWLVIDPTTERIESLKDGRGWEISTAGKKVALNGRSVWDPEGAVVVTITGGDFRNSNIAAGNGIYQS